MSSSGRTGERLGAIAAALGFPLDSGQVQRLVEFEDLLRSRAVPLGLISPRDSERLRHRHTLDCLRAALAVEDGDSTAYDLGAGAGLPGIVLAIAKPELSIVLVEPRLRRVAFLELVVLELGLDNVSVAPSRAEELHERVQLCFARALARLDKCWTLAEPLLLPGGRLVYFSGVGSGPRRAPGGARIAGVLDTPLLESSGPLVIMARR